MKIKKNIPLIDQHDRNGFWGGKFGGSFIPETLKKPVEDLTKEFSKLRNNKKFLKKRDYYFKNYIGSPTSFLKLENLSNHLDGAQIWAKVVSEANGGAHKIYNATVHALICKAMGKKYIVGDTGAGYAGKMLSMAAKKFGLKCKIFMGTKDIKRQKPNCDAMRKNGAEIVPVYSGSQTLVDAVSECMRYWVSNCDTTHMCVGSTVGPNIFVKICGWSTAQISRELKIQIKINSNGQGFDFELVSKLCKLNFNIGEIFVKYEPRKNSNEKKIKFYHMFVALYQIFKVKFFN